jgi:hypothetical protein
VQGNAAALTGIRRRDRKIVTSRRQRKSKAMIRKACADGIRIASWHGEGTGFRLRVFDPPPLVATFGRSEPAPIFFPSPAATERTGRHAVPSAGGRLVARLAQAPDAPGKGPARRRAATRPAPGGPRQDQPLD